MICRPLYFVAFRHLSGSFWNLSAKKLEALEYGLIGIDCIHAMTVAEGETSVQSDGARTSGYDGCD